MTRPSPSPKVVPIRPTTAPTVHADPSRRGFGIVYRPGEANHCPGCGRSNWYVGRQVAECGFCGTAIAMKDAG